VTIKVIKSWLAAGALAFCMAAQAQSGKPEFYAQVAGMSLGKQVAAGSAEAKRAEQYLRAISSAYNVPEDNIASSAAAALRVLLQKNKTSTLFDMFDAAQRIAPSEAKKSREGLVHALTTYVGAYEPKAGPQAHDKAIEEVIALNKGGAAK
jgi:predicted PhzF superfamily epimerase YddE/YHI9